MPKTLSILAAGLIVLAFILRAVAPENLFVPGGWPVGSHWYHTGFVAFWLFLIAELMTALVVAIKTVVRSQAIR